MKRTPKQKRQHAIEQLQAIAAEHTRNVEVSLRNAATCNQEEHGFLVLQDHLAAVVESAHQLEARAFVVFATIARDYPVK